MRRSRGWAEEVTQVTDKGEKIPATAQLLKSPEANNKYSSGWVSYPYFYR